MKQFISTVLWLALCLLLIASSNYLINVNAYLGLYDLKDVLFAHSWVLTLCLIVLQCSVKNSFLCRLVTFISWLTLLSVVLFALSELFIYTFSNVAFNEQTFLHFELESFMVGVKTSPLKYSLSFLITIALVSLCIYWKPTLKLNKNIFFALTFVLLSTSIFINFQGLAVGRFITGYYQFNLNVELSGLSAKEIEPYKELGIHPVYHDTASLQAEFKSTPKNLIVIYLESFSHGFSDSPRYPNLTPNINRLKQTYGDLENYHSTANITIQGIISSQCGMLPKLISGNNIGEDQIQYQNLPCLPNILHQLGYHQEFMGGAIKHFANKALHLESMQFDQVWGWRDYVIPKDYQANSWGLQDGDLFDKALIRIKDMNTRDHPFHLSLLTLSTHLNGNPDPNCPKYTESVVKDMFLDGIHCTDYLLGQFIDNLKNQNILDNTTVFITGDHGVFNVGLIKDLFGTDFNHHKLLGILMNGLDFDKSLPLGLYDMAPMLLDSLAIETNNYFINGLSPRKIKPDRFLLRENQQVPKNQFQPGCNKTEPIQQPVDACENQRLLKKSWAHAATFTPKPVWNQAYDPKVFIKSTQEKHQARLIINGQDQSNLFLINGYPINTHKRTYNHHIFVLVYDKKSNKVLDRRAYNFIPVYADHMRNLLNSYHNNKDLILFVFTEGGQQQLPIAQWDTLFDHMGSASFNFPKEPYIGIIRFADEGMQLLEWSQKDGGRLERSFANINLIDFKNSN